MNQNYPAQEALEFVEAVIRCREDEYKTASEVAQFTAYVYCTPMELFSLWWRSFTHYITTHQI